MNCKEILTVMVILLLTASMTMCLDADTGGDVMRSGENIADGGATDGDDGGDGGFGDNDGDGDDDDDGDGGGSGGKVKLVFWHTFQYAKEVELIKKAVKEFESTHPNIRVNVQQQTYEDGVEKYITASLGGEAPDVMRVPNDRLGELADLDLIAPVDQFISVSTLDTYVPMSVDAMKYRGSIYALPASYDSIALIYNKNLLSEKGYSSPPGTLDELVTMADSLTYADRYGFVMPITDPYWWFAFQYGFGGRIFDSEGKPAIDSEGAKGATEFLFDLEKEHGVLPKGGVDKNLMMALFTEQKAAMIATGPWNIEDIKAADVPYGIAPLPRNEEADAQCAPLVGVKGYVISRECQHKLEAYQLLQFLTSHNVTKDFALVSDTLPSVGTVYGEQVIKDDEVIQGFLAQAEVGQKSPSIPEMSKIWNPLTDALQLSYSGDKSIAKALADAQDEIEKDIGS